MLKRLHLQKARSHGASSFLTVPWPAPKTPERKTQPMRSQAGLGMQQLRVRVKFQVGILQVHNEHIPWKLMIGRWKIPFKTWILFQWHSFIFEGLSLVIPKVILLPFELSHSEGMAKNIVLTYITWWHVPKHLTKDKVPWDPEHQNVHSMNIPWPHLLVKPFGVLCLFMQHNTTYIEHSKGLCLRSWPVQENTSRCMICSHMRPRSKLHTCKYGHRESLWY